MDGPKFHLAKSDAVDWLRKLPAESVDLVVTDPPYESLEKHRAIGTTTRLKHSKASSNDWFSIFPNDRFPELFEQVYRVLKRNSHFYLYCDPETMFVAKPLGEAAGFKFWKPLIWDKCLAPDTLVWTTRGVVQIDDIVEGDRVAIPEGGTSPVVATRRTRAPSIKLSLSDGTELVASRDHRFMLASGELIEARGLQVGSGLLRRDIRERTRSELLIDRLGRVALDYDFGRVVGRFAAEGNASSGRIAAACSRFVGGDRDATRYLEPEVYAAPVEFRDGVVQGLEDSERAGASRITSIDLVCFLERARHRGTVEVVAIEEVGERELVDVSIADRDELFLLANGVVTHNCSIGMGYHYRARYECILFFEKGKRKLSDLGAADIIEHKRIVGGYPAEKPPGVSEVLIKQSTEAGQVVIDPFMGSGSVGVAALSLGRAFCGNDVCDEAVEIARERLVREGGVEMTADTVASAHAGQLGLGV